MRLVVVSPFLDRRHGTELCIIEQIERLASVYGWEIHLYSQHVEDIRGLIPCSFFSCVPAAQRGAGSPAIDQRGIYWHKISAIPGPHLLRYVWWFCANQLRRRFDRSTSAELPQVVYSPGINCLDADAIVVHIVFHEFYARVRRELRLRYLPVGSWFLAIHRKLYYHLIMALERRVYCNSRIRLAAVSHLVANQLLAHFHRSDVTVIPDAVDRQKFHPAIRLARRPAARHSFGFTASDFVLLLIGNDWKNKGLDALLHAMQLAHGLPLMLLVVGRDDPGLYLPFLRQSRLHDRVRFLPPSSDVVLFYAAADAYVGPSLADAFGLPILEAMACGLPVIASVRAGASENIRHGETGLLLRNPADPEELAQLIRNLATDPSFCERIGQAASAYAQAHCTWEENASRTREFLEEAM